MPTIQIDLPTVRAQSDSLFSISVTARLMEGTTLLTSLTATTTAGAGDANAANTVPDQLADQLVERYREWMAVKPLADKAVQLQARLQQIVDAKIAAAG